MNVKRAILVMGPESTGTRLATRLLLAGGCQGDGDHVQRFDELLPVDLDLVVWRRSVPHAGAWPDLATWIMGTRHSGYAVEAVVTTRDWMCMCESQVAAGHVRQVTEAEMHARFAYHAILTALANTSTRYTLLSYEALVAHPRKVQAWLARQLRLPTVPAVEIVDANAKWYEVRR